MRVRRSRRAEVKPNLTSMGDIAFLLITFFVIASNFTNDSGQEIAPAKSQDIEVIKEAPDLLVVIDKHLTLWFDNKKVESPESLGPLLAVEVAKREGERRRILLKADASAPASLITPVLNAFAENSVPIAFAGDQLPPGTVDAPVAAPTASDAPAPADTLAPGTTP